MFREEKRQFNATHDYEPFGVELEPFGNDTTNDKYRFTGQERDTHTNFDYMHFRYYASSMGRFMKPDNVTGSPLNPQNWNLYSYVRGNPLIYIDYRGYLALRYDRNQSLEFWHVTFETNAQKFRAKMKRFIKPIVSKYFGTIGKIFSLVDATIEKMKGKEVRTDISDLRNIKGFKQGKFENGVKKKWVDIGGDTSISQITNEKPIGGDKSSAEKLQQAVDEVISAMIEKGDITKEEGEKIREVYDINMLMMEAKEAKIVPPIDPKLKSETEKESGK